MANKIKTQKTYLLILAFTSGLTIMAVEISASRLIAPYFGSSTFVWANIIGVIMIALSLGYYLGGRLSEKKPELKFLLEIVLAASALLFLIPFVTKPVVLFISQSIMPFQSATLLIFVGSLLAVAFLFIIPILMLGFVSPFIIKLLSLIDPQVGKDAGLVFSISTIGSVLGTFLPVLVFIPYFGTRKTILFFAFLLLFVALFGWFNKKWLSVLFFLFLIPSLIIKMPQIKEAEGVIYEDESVYQYMQIQDIDDLRLLKINEGMAVFSALAREDSQITPGLTGFYYDYYNLLPYLSGNHKKQDVLILGLAAGTISSQLNHFFANDYDLLIDGVEIDKKIIKIGKKYFDMENPSLEIYNLDGRNFLNLTAKKYDSIVLDVFSNQLYLPFHLCTLEFFQLVSGHLKEEGIVAMNALAVSENSALLKSITNTMLKVFDYVYWIRAAEDDWNYMVIASDNELDFEGLYDLNNKSQLNHLVQTAAKNNKQINYDYDFGILTDDKAPIEHLTDWMILDYIYNQF